MSTDTDNFEYDADLTAPPATLTDHQPERASGGGKYGAAAGITLGGDEGGSDGPAKETRCTGSISAPRYSDKGDKAMVVVDFTVVEPAEHAGYTAPLFCTVKGGTSTERASGLKDVAKLCKVAGVPAEGDLSDILDALALALDDRDDVPFRLKPKRNGGHFVNL